MTTTPRATASVRSPAELITLLPYQLGYRPRSSLVMVTMHDLPGGGATVGPVMRVDLPVDSEEAPADQALEELGRQLLQVLHSHGLGTVLLVAFEDEAADEDATATLAHLAALCTETGTAQLAAVARVRGERWCRLDVDGQPSPEATDPAWQLLPEPADVPAVAEFVLLGRSPVADRQSLCRPLDEDGPVLTHAAVRRALSGSGTDTGQLLRDEREEPGRERADRWAAIWAHVLREGPEDLDAGELALLVGSLRSLPFRDALLWWLTPGSATRPTTHQPRPEVVRVLRAMLPGERPALPALLERLHALAVRFPREHRGPVLAVLGVVAWWHGEGTVANIAVERALRQEPRYGLALLLDVALQRAVPPPGYRPGPG
ncbi:DUF4192 domain-containing protein [Ornithinicoccus halotolerans]|uniref:DUF4192 domain-containing protein n=1 Tax=Ornithinicoccus halotolerans TaxID=1748220 RepID=UPI0012967219|nr:DUF4192 domain-containing protein [Ornithinicoccus halotolerans]